MLDELKSLGFIERDGIGCMFRGIEGQLANALLSRPLLNQS